MAGQLCGQVDFLHEKGFLVVEHRDTYMDEVSSTGYDAPAPSVIFQHGVVQ